MRKHYLKMATVYSHAMHKAVFQNPVKRITHIRCTGALRPAETCHCRPASTSIGTSSSRSVVCNAKGGFFSKFTLGGTNAEEGGIYGAQGRDDYTDVDVMQYYEYMGMLAIGLPVEVYTEPLAEGMHPADVLLLLAAVEDDLPKVEELLQAGADKNIKDLSGKTPADLCSKEEIKAVLS